jgi:tetratricopeptide (TPR) repeat protein
MKRARADSFARGALRALRPAVLALLAPALARAQDDRALTQATALERSGRYAEAAARYRSVLQGNPANAAALLGLERVYQPLGHLDSLMPPLRAALKRDPANATIHALELRAWLALDRPDSLTAAARRWIALDSTSPAPYREWAYVLAQHGDMAGAKRVLGVGAAHVSEGALDQDLAQLTALSGEWPAATQRWVQVVRGNLSMLTSATAMLSRAPVGAHDAVLRDLLGVRSDSTSRLVAADLLVSWGRAEEAWPLLDANLPAERSVAASLLQRFADRAQSTRTPKAALVRGYALERLGTLVDAVAVNGVRLQAAQAYAEGGDLGAAQRLLERGGAANDSTTALAPAMTSLIRALAVQGEVEDAERQFKRWNDRLTGDDREALREAIARAWTETGNLDRAEAALGPDSGVAATAVRGWIAVYRGDLSTARDRFREAGPYTGTREDATARMGTLVLLERIDADHLPAFGAAMHDLSRGDTASAVSGFARVGHELPARGGGADVLAFAGELAVARRDLASATTLLGDALAADSTAPSAPAAELALADADAQAGRHDVATHRLEHLILAYPESAIVPQARRLLDRLRGAVPP